MWLPVILLSAFFWASSNILDSVLVRHIEKHPVTLNWFQAVFGIFLLLLLVVLVPVSSSWAMILLVGGSVAYVGDCLFCYVLDRLDISAINAAWAINAILVSLSSFLLFGEWWSIQETVGAALILSGVFLLSFYHRHISLARTLLLLSCLAACYLPVVLVQKAAVRAGEGLLVVFFWSVVGRECLALGGPLLIPHYRRRILTMLRRPPQSFLALSAGVVVSFSMAMLITIWAYDLGPLSLVSVASNVQPFFVMTIAWMLSRFVPSRAPRELLTGQSVRVKLTAFTVVFAGLALLAL